jgi:hypothetical protein
MSFNIGQALLGGIEGLITGKPLEALAEGPLIALASIFGSSPSSQSDPSELESALAQQPDAVQSVNTLSSLAQSQPQTDNLLAGLIDGDQDEQ